MPVPTVIGRWLRKANDRLGTRLIAAAPTEVEDTIRIDGLPTRVKFNPGTTLGRIEAPRSVFGEMEPGLVSDSVHTTRGGGGGGKKFARIFFVPPSPSGGSPRKKSRHPM